MQTLTIKPNQKPTKETIKRLSELRDEDIVYDDDCPEITPEMEAELACAAAQRKLRNVQ